MQRTHGVDQMSVWAFRPWVGPYFESEGLGGVKLLVLGEAQYSGQMGFTEPRRPHPSEVDETTNIVNDLAINGPVQHRPFWTKVTKLVLCRANNEPVSKEERADFWNRVAFYNYIQWWMPAGRTKPTRAMWDEAREPFLGVVSELLPDLILVLGRRIQIQGKLPLVSSTTVCIPHPSSLGFTYSPWSRKIQVAFDAASKTASMRAGVASCAQWCNRPDLIY